MSRMLLMQSILGHMALLAEKHPKKANSAVTKKARAAVEQSLKLPHTTTTTTMPCKTVRRAA
jgi:hypothetical protein